MVKTRLVLAGVVCIGMALPPVATARQQADRHSTARVVFDDPAAVTTRGETEAAFHPARVLVRFRSSATRDFLRGSASARSFSADPNLYLVENVPGLSVAETVRRYQANLSVLYAEPDYAVHTVTIPSDPRWSQQWDMMKISAPTAWNLQTDATDVVVAVIDTGIDLAHPDLLGNLWTNSDGSHGFTCLRGRCVKGGSDDYGHGTHVAGTIGAVANNGIGIAGINWKVQLLSLKFLDANGNGYISDAIAAFDQVTALKRQGVNVRVTSNSWGGGGFSQALKDAMARGEAAGVLHVCAAGNSNVNADASPMYPGAYENRGIVSVLASDKNDAGASFTNYGLANVDIAAPGVSTLSTVPKGSCALCDSSGYKLLSGTSMAAPHVSAVVAALFQANPALTPNEVRDVVLDPRSYDAVTDAKARSTSTGGRLNFAKALTNPRLFAPVLNNFPVLTMGPDVFAPSGGRVDLPASAVDRDRDTLRMLWVNTSPRWLFGWMLKAVFPSPDGSSFTAPPLARAATVPYDVSVADGRGGSGHGRTYVTVAPVVGPGGPPSGMLTASPTDAPVGSTVTVSFPAADPENGQVAWDLMVGSRSGWFGACCYAGASTTVKFNEAGVYRVATQAIDSELNLSTKSSVVVRIGGATGEPPIANAVADTSGGPIPLTVDVDLSASVDPDGSIRNYYVACGEAVLEKSRSAHVSCTFATPGAYWIKLLVEDNSGYLDVASVYAVATPQR